MTHCPPVQTKNVIASARNRNLYKELIGNAAWNRLHPAIRKRFSYNEEKSTIASGNSKNLTIYQGCMSKVQMSFMGNFEKSVSNLLKSTTSSCLSKIILAISTFFPEIS